MIISQQLLRAENARRIRAARPEPAARVDPPADGESPTEREDPKVLAVCVLRGFDLPAWLGETYAFARRIGPEAATAWRHDFTRTVFLAGNPANLRERFDFDHVAGDGSTAWLGPAPAGHSTTLRRLLKLFPATAELPALPRTAVELPADGSAGDRAPVHRELYLATAGLTIAACLVHLHHLVSEAVLDGLLGPGDRLTLRPLPHLAGVTGPFAALRVGTQHGQPHRLRAYAALGAGRTA